MLGVSVRVTVVPTLVVQLLVVPAQPVPLAISDPPATGEATPVTVPWVITGLNVAVSVSGFGVDEAPALIVHVEFVPADAAHVPPDQPAKVKALLEGLAMSVTVSVAAAVQTTEAEVPGHAPVLESVPLIVPPVPALAVIFDPVASAVWASGNGCESFPAAAIFS